MRAQCAEDLVNRHIPPKAYADQWDVAGLKEAVTKYFNLELPVTEWAAEEGIADEEILDRLSRAVDEAYAERAADIGPELMRRIEKQILLQTIDQNWREHLQQLDALRSVIGLRGYAQRDPLNEYKTEAFSLFEGLLDELRFETTRMLFNLRLAPSAPIPAPRPPENLEVRHADPATGRNTIGAEGAAGGTRAAAGARAPLSSRVAAPAVDPADPSTWGRVSRNELCPCGSGKKYKHCHGKVDAS